MNQKYSKLPPNLSENLYKFEKTLIRIELLTASALIFISFFISYVFVVTCERFLELNSQFRWMIWGLTLFIVMLVFLFWVKKICGQVYSEFKSIELISKYLPLAADHIRGALELSKENEGSSNALRLAAIDQIDRETKTLDFTKVLSSDSLNKIMKLIYVFLVMIFIGFIADLNMMMSSMERWMLPWSTTPRYTFVQLENVDKKIIVPAGEDFEIKLELSKISRWVPEKALTSYNGKKWGEHRFANNKVKLKLSGITYRKTLIIKAGDNRKLIEVQPVFRPILSKSYLTVELPEYLNLPTKKRLLKEQNFDILKGSKLQLELHSNTKVKKARWKGEPITKVEVDENIMRSSFVKADVNGSWNCTWKDENKFISAQSYSFQWGVVEDKKPKIEFVNYVPTLAMIADGTIKFQIKSSDEFGLKAVEVWLEVKPMQSKTRELKLIKINLSKKNKIGKSFLSEYIFSPKSLEIPPQSKVQLKGMCLDDYPNRLAVFSEVCNVYVLGKSEHADLLKDRFRKIVNELDATNLKEEHLLSKHEALSEKSQVSLNSEENKKNTEAIQEQLAQNAKKLKEIQDEMKKLIDESLLNDEIPSKDLEAWMKMMEDMENINENLVPKTQAPLNAAIEKGSMRKEELQKALGAHKKLLQALKSLPSKAENNLRNMEIRNFMTRLKIASQHEESLISHFKKLIPKIIGLQESQLPSEVKIKISKFSRDHSSMQEDMKKLKSALYYFYARVSDKVYIEIHDDMESKKMVNKLTELSNLIAKNQLMNAIPELKLWSEQFLDWANKLQLNTNENESGENKTAEIDLEGLLELLRLIEKQQNLREETINLEELKEIFVNHPLMAKKLSFKQRNLLRILLNLLKRVGDSNTATILEKAGYAMKEAIDLLKNANTGPKAVAAQDEVIELLTRGFQSEQENSNMSMAMQMMLAAMMQKSLGKGTGVGNVPGLGSSAGGGGMINTISNNGNSKENVEKNKNRSKSMKGFGDKIPLEFKKSIELYIQKMENIR